MVHSHFSTTLWYHLMETFSELLALCGGNPLVISVFLSQRPMRWIFHVFCDLHLNKWLSKQSRWRWLAVPSSSLWRPSNDTQWSWRSNKDGHWTLLTHWGRDKMDAISQTAFSNAFSWMKMFEYRLKFHWNLFLRVQLTTSQHWFR